MNLITELGQRLHDRRPDKNFPCFGLFIIAFIKIYGRQLIAALIGIIHDPGISRQNALVSIVLRCLLKAFDT